MNVIRNSILLLLICTFFTSCTVLQWRSSDKEIAHYFKQKGITSSISYFNVDSLNLKVRVQHVTTSTKPVNVVFFHGSPSSLSAWNGYFNDSLFLKQANMHAVDRPGYGYSNFGKPIISIKQQARVMSDLITHYKLKNVIVVGASYGGPLVSRIAIENPNVKGVVMISPAIDAKQEKKIWASRFTQWWLTRWLVPTAYRVAGDEKTTHAKALQAIENDWSKVSVPVLHIHGNADDLVPYGNTTYTKAQFKDLKVITIPDAGHEISWSKPELVKPHIISLIHQVLENSTMSN